MVRRILFLFLFVFALSETNGQSFLSEQLKYPRVQETYNKNYDKLKGEFEEKGLKFPAKYIYIRSYKYDSKLEIWVKDKLEEPFSLFKQYDVCALSGNMGRKERQGDLQVPEGFYYIDRFQPQSSYHLSLKVNYPNFSDRRNSRFEDLGGGIYIHGSCVTVGCIPITDKQIDEVYLMAVLAKNAGQDFIPIHILPIDFDNETSLAYLTEVFGKDDVSQKFWNKMKEAYDYFNSTHKIPVVLYDQDGKYEIERGKKAGRLMSKEPDSEPELQAKTAGVSFK